MQKINPKRQQRQISKQLSSFFMKIRYKSNSTLDYTEDNIAHEEYIVSEKCLFYVALTRARKSAFITGYGSMSELII